MSYSVKIEPIALQDVQQAVDYYDDKLAGLGEKFEAELNEHIIFLETNPHFQVRYKKVHCLPLRKYPYMIHYTIDEENKLVTVRGVFHTSRNPELWTER